MKKYLYLYFIIFLCVECKKEDNNHNTNRITNEDHVIYFCEELSSTESQLVSYDIDNAEKKILLKDNGYITLESSPIGDKVVLVQESPAHDTYRILLFDLQTKVLKLIYTTDTTTQISYCNLTTDLQHIYFAEHESNNLYHMYLSIIDTNGNNYKNLDDCNYFLQSPHEIPGSNQIVYLHQTYLSFHNEVRILRRIDFTGNNKLTLDTALYHDSEIDVYDNTIAYVTASSIKTINSDGSNKQKIKADTGYVVQFPKFNNNGTSLTYYRRSTIPPFTDPSDLRVIDMNGNNIRTLPTDLSFPFYCYSSDGAFLVIFNQSGKVYINDGTPANRLISNKLAKVEGLIPGAYFKKDI